MLRFTKLSQRPQVLYRFTGLTLKQFSTLSGKLKPLSEQAEKNRLCRRGRKRAIGQGGKYKLSCIEDKLLLSLVFYRFSLTDELLGYLFGLDKSNICRMREKIEPLLEKAADPSLRKRKIPSGTKKISRWEELLEICPEFAEVITDATEQQRRRPQKKVQRRYYSGKKKRHTIKTQITVNTQGKILLVSKSYPGKVHDYTIFQRENTAKKLPPGSTRCVVGAMTVFLPIILIGI